MSNIENNKRIVKNTVLLYFRMFLTMGVSLYTSRIVLNTLGVEDFGIYNVVGGIVLSLGFLNNSMAIAVQRFLSYEIGKGDNVQLQRIFNISVLIHIVIAIFVFVFAETLGLWFLNTKINIPEDRMMAAQWVYQFSIFTFIIYVLQVPYNAVIISREKMNIYAYMSILDTLLKLIIVFILVWFSYDKLKLYAILTFGVSLIITILYRLYCKYKFKECSLLIYWDKRIFKTLISFSGWSLFGEVAWVMTLQGVNFLLNIFFGPAINAARGISFQVNTAINQFVSNFQMAVNPQIIKAHAANDKDYMMKLIFRSTNFSYYLLLFLSLPILLETEIILNLWLKTVPEYTIIFCRLIIINSMIDAISNLLATGARACGKIKKYQLSIGFTLLLNFPISYMLLKMGYPPQVTFYVYSAISIILLFLRIILLKRMIELNIEMFFKKVIISILIITLLSLIPPLLAHSFLPSNFLRFICVGLLSSISVGTAVYTIGLNQSERIFIIHKIKSIIKI